MNASVYIDKFAVERVRVYGSYAIEQRALVDFRDGLKPVQRRIIWGMHKLGITANSAFSKSAKVVGFVMGNLHPHGDAPIYDTMVNMVNKPIPLIKGMGNFGHLNENAAADRYTEVKLTPYGQAAMLSPAHLEVGEYIPTYDGTDREPLYLPAVFPYLLVSGTEGIAVGITGHTPPFAFKGVKKLITKAIEGDKISVKDCMKHLELNYPYGNNIDDIDRLKLFFETGESTIKINPTYEIENETTIVIKDVPPHFQAAKVTERLLKIPEVKSASDFSDSNFSYIVEIFPSYEGADLDKAVARVINTIAESLTLRATFNKRTVKKVETFSIKFHNYFNMWAEWRLDLEKASQTNILSKINDRIADTDLLILACNNLDVIFPILKRSKTPVPDLQKALKLTEDQASRLMRFTLNSLSRLSLDSLKEKKQSLIAETKTVQSIIKNPVPTVVKSIEGFKA